MIKKFLLASICLMLLLSVISCNEKKVVKVSVVDEMTKFEEKYEWLDYRLELLRYDRYKNGSTDSLEYYQDLYNYVINDDGIKSAIKQGSKSLTDENDLRRFNIIKQIITTGTIESAAPISNLKDSIAQTLSNPKALFDAKLMSSDELYRIYTTDDNRSRRESAYRAFCSVGEKTNDGLERLFKLRNQKAKRLGYNNYLGLSFKLREFDLKDYQKMLKNLEEVSIATTRFSSRDESGTAQDDHPGHVPQADHRLEQGGWEAVQG